MNRDPNMATAWTKHRAIVNYENFHNINVDLKSDHIITPIETIANSSLGISGWALRDVGLLEDAGEAGVSTPIDLLMRGTTWYHYTPQTSLASSIVGVGRPMTRSGASQVEHSSHPRHRLKLNRSGASYIENR